MYIATEMAIEQGWESFLGKRFMNRQSAPMQRHTTWAPMLRTNAAAAATAVSISMAAQQRTGC